MVRECTVIRISDTKIFYSAEPKEAKMRRTKAFTEPTDSK